MECRQTPDSQREKSGACDLAGLVPWHPVRRTLPDRPANKNRDNPGQMNPDTSLPPDPHLYSSLPGALDRYAAALAPGHRAPIAWALTRNQESARRSTVVTRKTADSLPGATSLHKERAKREPVEATYCLYLDKHAVWRPDRPDRAAANSCPEAHSQSVQDNYRERDNCQ